MIPYIDCTHKIKHTLNTSYIHTNNEKKLTLLQIRRHFLLLSSLNNLTILLLIPFHPSLQHAAQKLTKIHPVMFEFETSTFGDEMVRKLSPHFEISTIQDNTVAGGVAY